jgi:hypothetical protein
MLLKAEELSNELELIVAGGFPNAEHVVSSKELDMSHLFSSQEEAGTSMALHATDANRNNYNNTVVYSKDMDVLVLLIHHHREA